MTALWFSGKHCVLVPSGSGFDFQMDLDFINYLVAAEKTPNTAGLRKSVAYKFEGACQV